MSEIKPLSSLLPKDWDHPRPWEIVYTSPDIYFLYDMTAEHLAHAPFYRYSSRDTRCAFHTTLLLAIRNSTVELEKSEMDVRLGVVFWRNEQRLIIAVDPTLTYFVCGEFSGKIYGDLPKWLKHFCFAQFERQSE